MGSLLGFALLSTTACAASVGGGDPSSSSSGGGGAAPMCSLPAVAVVFDQAEASPDPSAGGGAPFATTWARAFGETAEVVDVAADPDGGLVVVGDYTGALDLGAGVTLPPRANGGTFVAKLDAGGQFLWAAEAPRRMPLQVVADAAGGVWLSSDAGGALLVTHFATGGAELGHLRVDVVPPGRMVGSGDGGVIVGGRRVGAIHFGDGGVLPALDVRDADVALVKIDPSGAATSARSLAPLFWSAPPGRDTFRQLAIDDLAAGPDGATTVLLSAAEQVVSGATCQAQAALLARLAPSGDLVWSRWLPPPNGERRLAVDAAGDALVTENLGHGEYGSVGGGSVPGPALSLALFDPNGEPRWTESFLADVGLVRPLFAPDGAILLAGSFQGSFDFGGGPVAGSPGENRLFVAALSPAGALLTSGTFDASRSPADATFDNADDSAGAVAVDASGALVFAGEYLGALDLGAGALPPVDVPDEGAVLYGSFLARIPR
jgi:hypothetical protein